MNTEIHLSVCRDVRKMPLVNHTSLLDKGAEKIRSMVINQGQFGRRCYFCDFSFGSWDGFEVHNLDGDHTNQTQDNLVPVCELCHLPFHLDLLGRKWPGDKVSRGKIIYLPEMSQVELNNLLQAVFFSMAMQTDAGISVKPEEADKGVQSLGAHIVYNRLHNRSKYVECNSLGEVIRPALSDPYVLSKVLVDMDDETYGQRAELLKGFRYLAPSEHFVRQAQFWNANGSAFSRLDLASWKGIAGVAE